MVLKKTVHVAVGVIQRHSHTNQREILIAKRHNEAHQGGLWEFPGGKVETGESLPAALARELEEELGLLVNPADSDALRPLIQIYHDYGDKAVLLDVWLVTEFSNAPDNGLGQEGQQVRWVDVDDLNRFNFPDANVPIISACQLPDHYVITPVYESLEVARDSIASLSEKYSGMILFRQPTLGHKEYKRWLESILASEPNLASRLMVSMNFANDINELLRELKSFDIYKGRIKGFHLPFSLARELKSREFDADFVIGVSCHSLEELRYAEGLRADFATLSPVRETASHPESLPLSWPRFEEWVKLATMPVYALGGMTKNDLSQCFKSGAQGIAGIGLWSNNL